MNPLVAVALISSIPVAVWGAAWWVKEGRHNFTKVLSARRLSETENKSRKIIAFVVIKPFLGRKKFLKLVCDNSYLSKDWTDLDTSDDIHRTVGCTIKRKLECNEIYEEAFRAEEEKPLVDDSKKAPADVTYTINGPKSREAFQRTKELEKQLAYQKRVMMDTQNWYAGN